MCISGLRQNLQPTISTITILIPDPPLPNTKLGHGYWWSKDTLILLPTTYRLCQTPFICMKWIGISMKWMRGPNHYITVLHVKNQHSLFTKPATQYSGRYQ